MQYHINRDEYNDGSHDIIVKLNLSVFKLEQLKKEFKNFISSSSFTGQGAAALKEYIGTAHLTVIDLIINSIKEFLIRFQSYSNGLDKFDTCLDAIFDEEYFSNLLRALSAMYVHMKEYQGLAKEQWTLLLDAYPIMPDPSVKYDDSYVERLDAQRDKILALKNDIKEYDTTSLHSAINVRESIRAAREIVDRMRLAKNTPNNNSESAVTYVKRRKEYFDSLVGKVNKYVSENEEIAIKNGEYFNETLAYKEKREKDQKIMNAVDKATRVVVLGTEALGFAAMGIPAVASMAEAGVVGFTFTGVGLVPTAVKTFDTGFEAFTGEKNVYSDYLTDRFHDGDREAFEDTMTLFGFFGLLADGGSVIVDMLEGGCSSEMIAGSLSENMIFDYVDYYTESEEQASEQVVDVKLSNWK